MSSSLKPHVTIRPWEPRDRDICAKIIQEVLTEYGLAWEPETSDRDVVEVEKYYWQAGGEFWVVEKQKTVVGTGGYYPIFRGEKQAFRLHSTQAEIRKMYLLPSVRGCGIGKFLLQQLEAAIAAKGFQRIWVETASVLTEAVKLYEKYGYQPATDVETPRCDRVYVKSINR